MMHDGRLRRALYGGEDNEVIRYTAGEAVAAHLQAMGAVASVLRSEVHAAVQHVVERLAATRHDLPAEAAVAAVDAVRDSWRAFVGGAAAYLAAHDGGLALRATGRVAAPRGSDGGGRGGAAMAVPLRGVNGVAVRANGAESADPGAACSLGVRAGAVRYGSVLGPAACIGAGCAACVNVGFKLQATPFGAHVIVVATKPLAANKLLLASRGLASGGGTCPGCGAELEGVRSGLSEDGGGCDGDDAEMPHVSDCVLIAESVPPQAGL